jgi:myo-inositol-1(or 4)-monophosphatase
MSQLEKIVNEVSILIKKVSRHLKEPIEEVIGENNPSTDIDAKISKILIGDLKKIINVEVLSEEDVPELSKENERFWVIDPIDGTMNFIVGSPDVAIAIALVDKSFNAIISVVFLPFYDELYTAIQGQGAYLNGNRIKYKKPKIDIISYGLPGDAAKRKDKITHSLGILIQDNYVLRQSGSATLDVCRVANGLWKAFFEEGLYVWDVVAADLIVKESGYKSFIRHSKNYQCDYVSGNTQSITDKLAKLIKDSC